MSLLVLVTVLVFLGALSGCGGDDSDESAPLLTLDPVTTPTNVTVQTLAGSMEAGATVSLSVDTEAVAGAVSYPTPTTWSAEISGLVEGVNTVIIAAADQAENTTSVAVLIVIDTVAEATLDPVAALTNQTDLTVTGTMEAGATVALAVDPAAVIAEAVYPTTSTWSVDVGGLAEGQHSITVTATDTLGNVNTLDPVTVVVDLTPPQVTSNLPATGAILIAPATLSVTFSEAIDVSTLTPGSFVLRDSTGRDMGGSLFYIPDQDPARGGTLFLRLANEGIVPPAGVYTATVTRAIRDLAGNEVAEFSWSFTVL